MATKIKQSRLSSEKMFPLMQSYESSQLTQKQFCKQHELAQYTFTYWWKKYQQNKPTIESFSKEKSFLKLDVKANNRSLSSDQLNVVRIIFPNGTLVEIPIQ